MPPLTECSLHTVVTHYRDDLEGLSIPNGNQLDAIHDGSVIKGVIFSLRAKATGSSGIPFQ